MVKNLPNQSENAGDIGIPSMGQADPLEEGMATHTSVLAWEIPPTEEDGRLQSLGWQRVRQELAIKQQHCISLRCTIYCFHTFITTTCCPP